MAVLKFNQQFGRHIKYTECDIFSIDAGVNSDIAYEIITNEENDFVRLRMYLSFSRSENYVTNYRLYEDETFRTDELGDELWVSKGVVDKNLYPFKWITKGSVITEGDNISLENDNGFLLLESGDYLLLESV
jgi:hypothetical protein